MLVGLTGVEDPDGISSGWSVSGRLFGDILVSDSAMGRLADKWVGCVAAGRSDCSPGVVVFKLLGDVIFDTIGISGFALKLEELF